MKHLCDKFESNLAKYAIRCKENLKHEYKTTHPLHRSFFMQDKDRILHSEAFRRLGYKTQVFVVHEGDFYRTRLTHSLEVAQISRSIALALDCNEDLVEAVAYAHDLGHPPFGHRGEECLDRQYKNALEIKFGIKAKEDRKYFEQNFQSYRIVSELEKRYIDHPGLNLSEPTLKALLRHETEYDIPQIPFPLEICKSEKIERIKRDYFDTKSPSLEAQIVNSADQIAWVTHDLEDALRVRFLSVEDLNELENPLLKMAEERMAKKASSKDKILWGRLLIRNMIDILITDLVRGNHEKIVKFNSPLEIENCEKPILNFSPEFEKSVVQMRDFLYERVYTHPIAERMSSKASMILEKLFKRLTEDIESKKSHSKKLLPYSTQNLVDKEVEPIMKLQTVIDFISGMTDRFATEFYSILFAPEERGITSLY
jgi:dGTPase